MNSHPFRLAGWFLGAALAVCVEAFAEEVAKDRTVAPEPEPEPEEHSIMPGIFSTELTRLITPESLRLTLRPSFGDLVRNDHFRLTLAARYGLTPQWELGMDTQAYVSHGLGGIPLGKELGFSRLQFGVKYRFDEKPGAYWETVAGLKYGFPVGNPPRYLTDGLSHLTPYLTHAHQWASRPQVTTFVSYGVDFISTTSVEGETDDGALSDDHWFVTPGVVWHRGAFDYSFETKFASTTGFGGDDAYRVTLRPGIKWTLPPGLTFHARSRWIVGASLSAGYGTGGPDYGVSLRLQTDFDFRRLFRRNASDPAPSSR